MASLSTDKDGTRRIQFKCRDGKRRAIRLGKIPIKDAKAVLQKIEQLASARITGNAPDHQTSVWLSGIAQELRAKLEKADLIDPKQEAHQKPSGNVLAFIETYIDGRADIKAQTRFLLCQTRNDFRMFLASSHLEEITLEQFTTGHAKQFRQYLIGRGLAENTVRRRCGRMKQFFDDAKDHRLIESNPFKSKQIPTSVGANEGRQVFVKPEVIDEVLKACPCDQWRLLIVLARYGGLRTPSEPLLLKWGDINWEKRTMIVTSPKTAHHEGKDSRLVPIFPEILPYLERVFDQAPDGSEYVLTRFHRQAKNLRTQFGRILKAAGVQPWEKLFQNLRSTRETELVNSYPIHVVCRWIGNSQAIAQKHYLQMTDDYLERATGETKSGAESGAAHVRIDSHSSETAEHRM